MAVSLSRSGCLDGTTIFRFSHGFDNGGGLEQYIDDLNSILSSRHRLHTVQIRLTTGKSRRETVAINTSQITTYYVTAENYISSHQNLSLSSRILGGTRKGLRDRVLYQPTLNRLFFRGRLAKRAAPRGITDPKTVFDCFQLILENHDIDLAILHSFGNSDSQLILKELKQRSIASGIINHFSNDRFGNSAAREQVRLASAVGAVSRADMPSYLGSDCAYMGDGIDTEFYRRKISDARPSATQDFCLLLPARLVESKGHLDLIAAAGIARKAGNKMSLYFAGRRDSSDYINQIQHAAMQADVAESVHIVGPQGREQLRDLYARSFATVLPSHHHEGLPRILLESQAMGVPCVAYDIGGVREGFIDRVTGFLIPKGNIKELSHALVRLAKDESLRRVMGAKGRNFVEEHFTLRALATRHESFISNLLGQ